MKADGGSPEARKKRTRDGTESMNTTQNPKSPSNPTIQVSWGELIDRMTILEIKEQRLTSPESVGNVRRELAALVAVAQDVHSKHAPIERLKQELKVINETLWNIEDSIRAKEAARVFDQEFIDLARSVYFQNDKRGDIKRQINTLMKSEIVEEKQYTAYRNNS